MKSGRKAAARSSPAKGAEKWGDDVDDSARPPFFGLPFDGDVAVSSDDVKVDATPAFVFHCSKLTVDACLNKKLFAMPDTKKNKKMMTKIEKDTKIQLYNTSRQAGQNRLRRQVQPAGRRRARQPYHRAEARRHGQDGPTQKPDGH